MICNITPPRGRSSFSKFPNCSLQQLNVLGRTAKIFIARKFLVSLLGERHESAESWALVSRETAAGVKIDGRAGARRGMIIGARDIIHLKDLMPRARG